MTPGITRRSTTCVSLTSIPISSAPWTGASPSGHIMRTNASQKGLTGQLEETVECELQKVPCGMFPQIRPIVQSDDEIPLEIGWKDKHGKQRLIGLKTRLGKCLNSN